MTIEDIVDRLRADPDCAIHPPQKNAPPLPAQLREEVRQFFSLTSGGHLFYHPDYPTPQFGCTLDIRLHPVSNDMGGSDGSYCEGAQFDHLFAVADYLDAGAYSVVAVSTMPKHYGHIFWLCYHLGNPTLTWDQVIYLAPSFTRWLTMHIEAWETYQSDWREASNTSISSSPRKDAPWG